MPVETLAFICEEKQQRRWGEKGKIIRMKKKDGSDDSSVLKIQTREEVGNVNPSCRGEMLFQDMLT